MAVVTEHAKPATAPIVQRQPEAAPKKLSMIVFSGDMDKVMAAFIIATGAAASGMEVIMFFTFWGLNAIRTGSQTGKSLFGRMLGLLNRGGIERIGPSRLNFGGMGRWMFKVMMRQHQVTPLAELRQMAIDLGVKLLPCGMSMDVMEISPADLIPEATEPVGVATFIEHAQQSQTTLFI
ncbi:MAG: DsrE/DsrF/DrsH-like family protein [Armatimonadota bacterium]|nr:DsrE/DsrF/DrsH-like family protein [Armatimonadota bacterium]